MKSVVSVLRDTTRSAMSDKVDASHRNVGYDANTLHNTVYMETRRAAMGALEQTLTELKDG